jgi:hypothetical protein
MKMMMISALALLSGAVFASDYCSYSERKTVLLIDQTTQYDAKDRQILKEGLSHLYRSLETGERLVVHSITDDPANSERIFEGCFPGCREPSGLLDQIWSPCNPARARRDQEVFTRGLRASLEKVVNDRREYPHSALLETTARLAREYSRSGALSRITVFSDFIENSSLIPWQSVVRGNPETLLRRKAEGASFVQIGERLELSPQSLTYRH